MDVNIAALGVDITKAVKAWLCTTEPENPPQNPVPPRELIVPLWRPYLSGITSGPKYGTGWQTIPDSGANNMFAQGRLPTTGLLSDTFSSRGDRPLTFDALMFNSSRAALRSKGEREQLPGDVYIYCHK